MFVPQSASLECESLSHNQMSAPIIQNDIWNFTHNRYINNATVLVGKVIVMTQGTRCDGIIDCWNGEDEDMCGFNTFETFGAGNVLLSSSMLKFYT